MKKAVIYARYSSDKQTEQSIEGQLYDCYNYAKDNNIKIVHEYIDRAMTGKNDDRPNFQKMIRDSALKQWDYVLVWKLDRFARNSIDSAIYRNELSKSGVKILSAMETFGDDPTGQMMERIIEAMNEFYSADLREKTIRGLRQSALKCNNTGGHIPIGYKSSGKKIVIDEKKRIIPETAFKMYAEGARLKDIADELNNRGYRTKNGKLFTVNSFYAMLSNEKYIGVYHFKDIRIEGGCPALIEKGVFDLVQKKLSENKKRSGKAKVDYILSGKLFCGHCGEPMSGLSGTSGNGSKYHYYRCNSVQKRRGCKKRNEIKENLEQEVCQAARDAFMGMDLDKLADEVSRMFCECIETSELNERKRELKQVRTKLENTANAIAEVGFSVTLSNKLKELEEQEEALASIIRVGEHIKDNCPTKEDVREIAEMIINTDVNSDEGRKWLIDIIIDKVYVYDDHLHIVFKGDNGTQDISVSTVDNILNEDCDNAERFVYRPQCGTIKNDNFRQKIVV